jgi:hypothetical protein
VLFLANPNEPLDFKIKKLELNFDDYLIVGIFIFFIAFKNKHGLAPFSR